MTNDEGSFNLINQDTTNKLNFYNKVIPNLPHSLNDLLEKAKSVESKLDTNKNGANEAGIENSEVNKYANMKEKQKRDTKFFEFDNFRRVNNYIPKIHINKHKERDGENFILPFASNKDDNFKGIMSLYNEKDLKDYCEPLPNNFFVMQEKNEEGNIIRNDIDYDYTLPPNFYTNRYVEYIYEDRGDKLYEDNNELKNLFGKNPNKDNKNEFNSITKGSPYLKAYHNILEKEKEDIENENKEIYQNEMSRGLEFTLDSEESQNILNFLRNNKDSYKEKNPLENFLEKNLPINQRVPFINVPNEAKKEEKGKKKKEEEIKKVYTPDDIAFELDVQGTIIKKLRKNKKKVHPRGIILHGPIARWFRLNQDGFDVEKGHFDIRKIEFDDDKKKQQNGEENIDENNFINNFNNNNKDDNIEEDITVKDVFEKGKLNKKDTIFTSRKIEEFGEKTFKYCFRQVKEYLTELLININGASYNVLKFLSDTNYTNLEITSDKHSTLIKYIYWHPKLQELCIPAGFLGELKEVIDSKDWECKLITLSIKKSNNDNNAENDLTSIFNNNNSLTIQNIHFIDIVYKKGFLDALFTHIEKFYNVNINKDDKYCITPENLETLRETKLPILNLSWKKTQNSDMNPKTDGVNIQGIYYLLMHMLIYSLKRNNGTIPQIFNKLDLSESTLEGSVNYLIKIITKFKIIKELDLSNTKLSNDIKVIDSNIFWSKIKLTDNIEKTFNQKEFYDSTLDDILEEIDNFRNNKQKEEEENNNNMNQKSDDDTSYDYSMGILPLLEKIYLYNTETKSSVSDEIYSLFRKLKFFRGIYYSDPNSRNNQENINNVNFCDALVEKINRDKKTFCEDVFMISNDPKN